MTTPSNNISVRAAAYQTAWDAYEGLIALHTSLPEFHSPFFTESRFTCILTRVTGTTSELLDHTEDDFFLENPIPETKIFQISYRHPHPPINAEDLLKEIFLTIGETVPQIIMRIAFKGTLFLHPDLSPIVRMFIRTPLMSATIVIPFPIPADD